VKNSEAARRVDGLLSEMHIVAPREERSLDVASPIPDAPPVMAMTLPCIGEGILGDRIG